MSGKQGTRDYQQIANWKFITGKIYYSGQREGRNSYGIAIRWSFWIQKNLLKFCSESQNPSKSISKICRFFDSFSKGTKEERGRKVVYWLNFISVHVSIVGWQPRWFVLEVGVLAYYKSQEEVGLGSRGSVKMTCCEISGMYQSTSFVFFFFT